MAERHADAAFALEQFNVGGVFAPAPPQHFDGHHPPGLRIIGPVYPSEAAGRDLVEEPVAAKQETVAVAFAELVDLQSGQEALAFQMAKQRIAVRSRFAAGGEILHAPCAFEIG